MPYGFTSTPFARREITIGLRQALIPIYELGPIEPVLQRIDPLLATPVTLTNNEFQWLLDFVRDGLQDPRATPQRLRQLIPNRLPSGRPLHIFQ